MEISSIIGTVARNQSIGTRSLEENKKKGRPYSISRPLASNDNAMHPLAPLFPAQTDPRAIPYRRFPFHGHYWRHIASLIGDILRKAKKPATRRVHTGNRILMQPLCDPDAAHLRLSRSKMDYACIAEIPCFPYFPTTLPSLPTSIPVFLAFPPTTGNSARIIQAAFRSLISHEQTIRFYGGCCFKRSRVRG